MTGGARRQRRRGGARCRPPMPAGRTTPNPDTVTARPGCGRKTAAKLRARRPSGRPPAARRRRGRASSTARSATSDAGRGPRPATDPTASTATALSAAAAVAAATAATCPTETGTEAATVRLLRATAIVSRRATARPHHPVAPGARALAPGAPVSSAVPAIAARPSGRSARAAVVRVHANADRARHHVVRGKGVAALCAARARVRRRRRGRGPARDL